MEHFRVLEAGLARAPLAAEVETFFAALPEFTEAMSRNPYLMPASWEELHKRRPPARDAQHLYARRLTEPQHDAVVSSGEVRLSVLRGMLSANELDTGDIERLSTRRMPVGSAMLLALQPAASVAAIENLIVRLPARAGVRMCAFTGAGSRLDDGSQLAVLTEWARPIPANQAQIDKHGYKTVAPAWRSLPGFRAVNRILWQRPILRHSALNSASLPLVAAASSFNVSYTSLSNGVTDALNAYRKGDVRIPPVDLVLALELLIVAEVAWSRPGYVAADAIDFAAEYDCEDLVRARLRNNYGILRDMSRPSGFRLDRDRLPAFAIGAAGRNAYVALNGLASGEEAEALSRQIAIKSFVELYGEATTARCLRALEAAGAEHREVPALPKRTWRPPVEEPPSDVLAMPLDKLLARLDVWPYGATAERVANAVVSALGDDLERWQTLRGLDGSVPCSTLGELLTIVTLL